jgi:hypothetical protein
MDVEKLAGGRERCRCTEGLNFTITRPIGSKLDEREAHQLSLPFIIPLHPTRFAAKDFPAGNKALN